MCNSNKKCTTPRLENATLNDSGCTPKLEKTDLTNWYNLKVPPIVTCVWQEENGAPITSEADEIYCIDDA